MKHIYCRLAAFASIAFLIACSVVENFHAYQETSARRSDYEKTMISENNLPLFAILDGQPGVKTKSSDISSESVSLESLLDRSKTSTKRFKQYKLKEVPFITNESPSSAILSAQVPESSEGNYMSSIGLFLVETTDTVENIFDYKVVTMIPDEKYMERQQGERMSFINKGVFSGAILFSDIDGTFRDIYIYGGDFWPILDAEIIDTAARSAYTASGFLTVAKFLDTKSSDDPASGGELEPSICIAFQEETVQDFVISIGWLYGFGDNSSDPLPPSLRNPDNGIGGGIIGGGGSINGGNGGNGGGGSYIGTVGANLGANPGAGTGVSAGKITAPVTTVGGAIVGRPKIFPIKEDVQKYSVILYAADGGNTIGSGEYQEGSFVDIEAVPDEYYVFDRWTGDLNGYWGIITIPIESDISSTAYFHHHAESGPFRPCYDAERNMYNPLVDMIIAPTDSNHVNFVGSTFGKTRYSGTTYHSGLDLYAPEGTPVYAMYDGTFSKTQRYVVKQPNRDKEVDSDWWPDGYTGDTNGAGNRFSLECEVDGEKMYIMYWHMQAGTPVATNPRTGKPFKPGDEVFAGELIGYTGRTGNAYDVDYYHLHLSIKNAKGEFINPEDFINGELQWHDESRKKIMETEIINIRCDEEPQKSGIEFFY